MNAKELLEKAVEKAAARVNESGDSEHLRKTLSKRKLKELVSIIESKNSPDPVDVEQRRSAIAAIGRSGDCRAFDLIERRCADINATVRRAVAKALPELGGPRAVQMALRLLTNCDTDVVQEAVKSLKSLAHPTAIRPLMILGLDDPILRSQAMDVVMHFGAAAVSELLAIVEERNTLTICDAVRMLGRIGDQRAVSSLLMALDGADTQLRCCIVETLGHLGARNALSKIVGLLSDPDESVQLSAVKAVQKMPDIRAVKPIVEILHRTQNATLRLQAVITLATSGSQKAVAILLALLPRADTSLQKAIAEALSRIDSREAAEALAGLLDVDDQATVVKALTGLRKNPVLSTVSTLIRLSSHPETDIRRHAIEALAETPGESVRNALEQRLLNDSSAEVRVASARGLGRLGDQQAVRVLEQSLKDESSIRCAAVVALGLLGDESSGPALLASLKDSSPEVRYHAVSGLAKLKATQASRAIRVLLDDDDDMVRLGAENSLQCLGYENVRVPRSRKLMCNASNLIPDRVAALLPTGPALAGLSAVFCTVAMLWLFSSSSTASTEHALALVRAKAVVKSLCIPGSADVILVRVEGPADIWDASNGSFKSKVDVPELGGFPYFSSLVAKSGDSLVPWAPEGRQTSNRAIRLPPAKEFHLSGDTSVAVYVTKNKGVLTWDTAIGRELNSVPLSGSTLPVLNSDGSLIAGADENGQIVVIERGSGKPIAGTDAVGNVGKDENGVFRRMLFSSQGNALAVIRNDCVIVATISSEGISTTRMAHGINAQLARFPSPNAVYSAAGTFITRLDLANGKVKRWEVTDRQVDINSWSLSIDESFAVASADNRKYGWVVNFDDESSRELSPAAWPGE